MATKKNVFQGTIGKNQYLFDAKTGEKVATVSDAKTAAEVAEAKGYSLIPREKANHEAVRKLINAWTAAKNAGTVARRSASKSN